MYSWNAVTSQWDRMGQDIDGEDSGDYSGSSVSLSGNGTTLPIGARRNDGKGTSSGHVRVFVGVSGRKGW